MEKNIDKVALLEHTRTLLAQLENENVTDAELCMTLDGIMGLRDSTLFHELGKMTREIHESIMNFRMDSRITDLAETEIPDAKDRLEYVIAMTEKAANTVLGVIERGTPMAEKLNEQSKYLAGQWQKFRRREMSPDELRIMGHELENFFGQSSTMMTELLSGFTEVLMAQDFQDLTGQIIRRVINLVNEIEGNLVTLIRIQGEHYVRDDKKDKSHEETGTRLEGPQVPGKEAADVMKGQDDVDDLLASLGF
ncbi:MAG: chemotaxis protein CheZ [Pseudomonadota bacterium]|nr:chemotaxis protein CheZ [Pseudomonadota bacterium]